MPQIREQIAMVHLPPSKTLKYLFHVRKTYTHHILRYGGYFYLYIVFIKFWSKSGRKFIDR